MALLFLILSLVVIDCDGVALFFVILSSFVTGCDDKALLFVIRLFLFAVKKTKKLKQKSKKNTCFFYVSNCWNGVFLSFLSTVIMTKKLKQKFYENTCFYVT